MNNLLKIALASLPIAYGIAIVLTAIATINKTHGVIEASTGLAQTPLTALYILPYIWFWTFLLGLIPKTRAAQQVTQIFNLNYFVFNGSNTPENNATQITCDAEPAVPLIGNTPEVLKIAEVPKATKVPAVTKVPEVPKISTTPEVRQIGTVKEVPKLPLKKQLPAAPQKSTMPRVPDKEV